MGEQIASFDALYHRHGEAVYGFCLWLCRDRDLANDLASETFVRAWTARGELRAATVRAFLFTIARNLHVSEMRRRGRLVPVDPGLPDRREPERELEAGAELSRTLRALDTLPELDRTALLLRARDGMSYVEIADVLDLSPAAARVRVHRARLKLALLCETEETPQ
jgi:RNA polymerase sigma-70 factor (ECF subfamily)